MRYLANSRLHNCAVGVKDIVHNNNNITEIEFDFWGFLLIFGPEHSALVQH